MKPHNWMMTHWKPATAFVYTLICLFDFVVFPSYVGINKVDLVSLIPQIKDMDPAIQSQIILAASKGFEPFTLRGSGLFHLAFGALLTGVALKNGNELFGLVYTDKGAEYRRRKNDVSEKEKKAGWKDDAGSPPTED